MLRAETLHAGAFGVVLAIVQNCNCRQALVWSNKSFVVSMACA